MQRLPCRCYYARVTTLDRGKCVAACPVSPSAKQRAPGACCGCSPHLIAINVSEQWALITPATLQYDLVWYRTDQTQVLQRCAQHASLFGEDCMQRALLQDRCRSASCSEQSMHQQPGMQHYAWSHSQQRCWTAYKRLRLQANAIPLSTKPEHAAVAANHTWHRVNSCMPASTSTSSTAIV